MFIKSVLEDLIHKHCQNCDGSKPLVIAQDEINITQAHQAILAEVVHWKCKHGHDLWEHKDCFLKEML